jgi:plastocyanin
MRRWLLLSLVLILALSVFAVACGSSTSTTTTAGAATTTTGVSASTTGSTSGGSTSSTQGGSTGGAQVTIKGFAFDPTSVTIKVGESVTWTNQDSTDHTVVADNGEFKSASLANGATFSFTFSKAGTYPYHCSIHPTMKGTVTVQ